MAEIGGGFSPITAFQQYGSWLWGASHGGPGFSDSRQLIETTGALGAALREKYPPPSAPPPSAPPPSAPPPSAPPPSATGPSVADLPPVPAFPGFDVLPQFALPGLGSFVRTGLAGIIAMLLLWPTAAGKGSDLRDLYAVPVAKPRAPGRRPRRVRVRAPAPGIVRPGRRPRAIPRPKIHAKPKVLAKTVVRAPPAVAEAVLPSPKPLPPPIAATVPATAGVPTTQTWPTVATLPGAGTVALPAPAAVPAAVSLPSLSTLAQYAAPLALTALATLARAAPGAQTLTRLIPGQIVLPGTGPGVAPSPLPYPLPLTQPNISSVPYAAQNIAERECSCARTRTRKKKPCRNPVVSTTKRTRGGKRYVTTTRRIECQA